MKVNELQTKPKYVTEVKIGLRELTTGKFSNISP